MLLLRMALNRFKSHLKDVDIPKYEEYLEATFEQILDALDMSFDELLGRPRQTGLGAFFG